MKLIWEAIKRTAALIAAEAATLMAAGSVLEIEAWKAAVMTAISAALTVWAAIGRSYYTDGKLTRSEIDEAFNQDK